MKTLSTPAEVLGRLVVESPAKRLTTAAQIVAEHKRLLRRAIRRGHSLAVISRELHVPKRTLQRHLSLAGLFFRRPRAKKGTAIRPYKTRKKTG